MRIGPDGVLGLLVGFLLKLKGFRGEELVECYEEFMAEAEGRAGFWRNLWGVVSLTTLPAQAGWWRVLGPLIVFLEELVVEADFLFRTGMFWLRVWIVVGLLVTGAMYKINSLALLVLALVIVLVVCFGKPIRRPVERIVGK